MPEARETETVIDQTVPYVRDADRNGLSDHRDALDRLSQPEP